MPISRVIISVQNLAVDVTGIILGSNKTDVENRSLARLEELIKEDKPNISNDELKFFLNNKFYVNTYENPTYELYIMQPSEYIYA